MQYLHLKILLKKGWLNGGDKTMKKYEKPSDEPKVSILFEGYSTLTDEKQKEIKPFQGLMDTTETAEVIRESFKDDIDTDFNMSSVDFKANTNQIQYEGICQGDFLCAVGFLPKKADLLFRIIKRNSVGLNARGRNDTRRV